MPFALRGTGSSATGAALNRSPLASGPAITLNAIGAGEGRLGVTAATGGTSLHDAVKRLVNRILWNRRPRDARDAGNIDELVLHDATAVHVEQMSDRCWWIGIDLGDGRYWHGNFSADSRGRMVFSEQENAGVVWEHDGEH